MRRATARTRCKRQRLCAIFFTAWRALPLDNCIAHESRRMIRWMIVIFLVLVFISALTPFLNKLGFGKLPGDLRFKLFGKERYIPLTTTILLSLIASIVSHWV